MNLTTDTMTATTKHPTRPFEKGSIEGVLVKPIKKFVDERGWLAELYREDDIPEEYLPEMCYLSLTEPGVCRGPHEHVDQADLFCFIGPSNFKLVLWDNRPASKTYWRKMVLFVGEDSPMSTVIPKGVVHAYKNIGTSRGVVINLPNRLYAGQNKKEQVDEIRHEEGVGGPFQVDD